MSYANMQGWWLHNLTPSTGYEPDTHVTWHSTVVIAHKQLASILLMLIVSDINWET
jgi:hypothetical protein